MTRIGVFDSGLGGLTVARALARRFPGVDLRYLGDTARLPYGAKSEETVTRYAVKCVRHLVDGGVDAVVVACNTVSACALPTLRETWPDLPVLGVIEPGADVAVEASRTRHIGVFGTERTVLSQSYPQAIHARLSEARVEGLACPLLVPLVEAGWVDHPVARLTVQTYLTTLFERLPHVDTLVLGCTHYPVLKGVIAEEAQRLRPDHVLALVDSAEAIAGALARRLAPHASQGPLGPRRFEVTDLPSSFARVAATFWPETLPEVHLVDLTMESA